MIYFRKRFISFILNCMSLASIVLMLQTALSLLVLVNSNPSLPQSMRDNAQQVAQQAIARLCAETKRDRRRVGGRCRLSSGSASQYQHHSRKHIYDTLDCAYRVEHKYPHRLKDFLPYEHRNFAGRLIWIG